jgi:hypothetical protein
MITGWAGTGINDEAIDMPTPDIRLYYRAGGFPLVRITKQSVSFPTRTIEERQHVVMQEGADAQSDFGWWIYFQRTDAYGSAYVELSEEDLLPLIVEFCPDTTVDVPEEAENVPIIVSEPARPAIAFVTEPECVGLAVIEDS